MPCDNNEYGTNARCNTNSFATFTRTRARCQNPTRRQHSSPIGGAQPRGLWCVCASRRSERERCRAQTAAGMTEAAKA